MRKFAHALMDMSHGASDVLIEGILVIPKEIYN